MARLADWWRMEGVLMPKVDLRKAELEAEERAGDLCQCGRAAEEAWEPHCMLCGSYWRDVDQGLFNDPTAYPFAIDEGYC